MLTILYYESEANKLKRMKRLFVSLHLAPSWLVISTQMLNGKVYIVWSEKAIVDSLPDPGVP